MATKIVRIKRWSSHLAIDSIAGGGVQIRNHYHVANGIIKATDYSNGDAIEIRLAGAKEFFTPLIQNAATGAIIPIASVGTYNAGANDEYGGIYLRTATISTAAILSVFVTFTIVSDVPEQYTLQVEAS